MTHQVATNIEPQLCEPKTFDIRVDTSAPLNTSTLRGGEGLLIDGSHGVWCQQGANRCQHGFNPDLRVRVARTPMFIHVYMVR